MLTASLIPDRWSPHLATELFTKLHKKEVNSSNDKMK